MLDEMSNRDSIIRPLDGLHCFPVSQKMVASMIWIVGGLHYFCLEEKVKHRMEIQCSEIIEWLPHSLAYFFRTVLLSLGHNQRIIHDFWK